MYEIDAEVEYLSKIDEIADKIIDLELNFKGKLRKSLEIENDLKKFRKTRFRTGNQRRRAGW